jgi:hypothetical protein
MKKERVHLLIKKVRYKERDSSINKRTLLQGRRKHESREEKTRMKEVNTR